MTTLAHILRKYIFYSIVNLKALEQLSRWFLVACDLSFEVKPRTWSNQGSCIRKYKSIIWPHILDISNVS